MKLKNLKGQKLGKLLVLHRAKNNKRGQPQWLCQCDCGVKKCIRSSNLITQRSCGCSKLNPHNLKNLDKMVFGKLTVIRRASDNERPDVRSANAYWVCQCECGKEATVASNNLLNGDTRSCGCLHSEIMQNKKWKGYEEIPMAYWRHLTYGANTRKIPMSITVKEAWELFIKQDKKCALTGSALSFGSTSKRLGVKEKTASLDRIDSKRGYAIDNIQWIHKLVQKMKNNISQEDFIKTCKLISSNVSV